MIRSKINFSQSYKDWLGFIAHSEDKLYYSHLLEYSEDILLDSMISGAKVMQEKLHVNAQQWSTIKKLLQAYNHDSI